MTGFTPLQSLGGGALIGLAACMLMYLHGRIAGISGILSGVLPPFSPDWGWRAAFLIGAIAAPTLLFYCFDFTPAFANNVPVFGLIISGLLVGFGITIGSGCTSGHGICGISRLSIRSIAATLTFMLTTTITVFTIRHVFGGF
ncbi:YeeE/YedE family protein [Paenochrobactrum sp. BZR 588]|uniref:YeeE/YedE family protein n=1 Tax=unclassified Paenochrobactrum TaxID=2639760 RepID=UPI0038547404